MDARTGEDPAQDRGAGAGLDPQRFGQGAGGPHHLVVEERGVQPLAADLGGLLQDPVVGGVPGERGPGAGLTGALHGGGADRPPPADEPILRRVPPPSASVRPGRAATR